MKVYLWEMKFDNGELFSEFVLEIDGLWLQGNGSLGGQSWEEAYFTDKFWDSVNTENGDKFTYIGRL